MKNLKKVLALVVVFAMMFTTVAFASYPDVAADADYAEAVEILSALEVLEGDDQGNFNPDSTIKRSEFAAVVIRALGMESSAAGAAGATSFVDVAANHWAAGYINLATQYGIINGRGNGIFDPDGNVTYQEAIKMLCVALGYAPMAETKGGYPAGYVAVAGSIGMVNGVPATSGAALRSTVAMLTANALEIPKMDQTGFGSNVTYEVLDDYDNYQTLLTDRDIYVLEGTVSAINVEDGTVDVTYTEGSDDYEFGWDRDGDEDLSDSPATIYVNNTNIADFYQKSVKVFVEKDAKKYYAVAVVAGVANETLTVDGALLDKATLNAKDNVKVEYYETKDATKTTKINVEAGATVYVNSKSTAVEYKSTYDLAAEVAGKDAVVEFVNNDDDKYFDVINVTIYQHALVEDVNVEAGKIFTKSSTLTIDEEEDAGYYSIADADGNEIGLADINEGDLLAIVCGGSLRGAQSVWKTLNIINLGDSSVTGTLNGYEDGYNVLIDGEAYEVAKTFVDGNEKDITVNANEAKMDVEGKFYLGITGKIVGFDGDAVAAGNYGYILKAKKDTSGFDDAYQIQMLTADGVVVVDAYKNLTLEYFVPGKDDEPGEWVEVAYTNGVAADKSTIADKFDEADVKADTDRIVEYKTNANGEVKYIKVLKAVEVAADKGAKAEYNADNGKIAGKTMAENVVVMNFNVSDVKDATMHDYSYLVDEGEYKGFAAKADDEDSEYAVFVITEGQAAFDAKAGIAIVASKTAATYNDADAIKIDYYQDSVLVKGAIIPEDATQVGTGDITKGGLLAIVADAEGVVSEYSVIAEMNAGKLTVNDANFKAAFGGNDLEEDAGYAYGYVNRFATRDGKPYMDVVIGDKTETFKVEQTVNQYAWFHKGNNPRVDANGWQIDEIAPVFVGKGDSYNFVDAEGKPLDTAYYVFVKVYEGVVTDVYSSTLAGSTSAK